MLAEALQQLFPEARSGVGIAEPDYVIVQDETGERIAAWHLDVPRPSLAEIEAAYAAWQNARAAQAQEAAALRDRVVTTAQTAVGVRIDQLTAQQVRALVAIMLWKAGALNADGTVRPLAEWL